MRLSEAILQGAEGREQGRGSLFLGDDPNTCPVCALGAASIGLYGAETAKTYSDNASLIARLRDNFPILYVLSDNEPGIPKSYDVGRVIVWMNDCQEKSFAEIVAYVEEKEAEYAAK